MSFDWINEYLSLTESFRAPYSFRLWSAISTISCILERRTWTITDGTYPLIPNQYIILAGGPGSGKTTMVSLAKMMTRQLAASFPDGIFVGPDNPTKASFLKQFEKSTKFSINGMGIPMYSAMSIFCMEFGVFVSKYEKDFIADITHIYDNPSLYTAPRTSVASTTIEAPTLNILAAATPDALGDTIPEVAWSQGFTSRFVFIYGSLPPTYRDPFKAVPQQDFKRLQDKLSEYFHNIHGAFMWEDAAQEADRSWFNEEKQYPIPTYGRLLHYNSRRNEHLMKLAMVSAVSAEHGLNVTEGDFRRAQQWLFEAENSMPDVFRAMHQKSDQQLLADAHHWLYNLWQTPKLSDRKPISEARLWKWFAERIPSDKIQGMIVSMHRSGRIRPGIPGEWIPNTFDKFEEI